MIEKSNEWPLIVSELEGHLLNARSIIENKITTPDDTAFYRGRIALCKELLKLPETLKLRAQRTIQNDN